MSDSMKRGRFLQQAGVTVAGGAGVLVRTHALADAAALAEYLAECTSREFVRPRQLEVVALRIGKVMRTGSATGQPLDPLWGDEREFVQAVSWRDAAEAFRLGLEIDLAKVLTRFEVSFILGDVPQGQFRNDTAKRVLRFRPPDDVALLWRCAAGMYADH